MLVCGTCGSDAIGPLMVYCLALGSWHLEGKAFLSLNATRLTLPNWHVSHGGGGVRGQGPGSWGVAGVREHSGRQ